MGLRIQSVISERTIMWFIKLPNLKQNNMKGNKKYWVLSRIKTVKVKPSEWDKRNIDAYFHPIVESFKKQYISIKPNKKYNYLVDVYSKWYQNYFYLCEKFEPGHLNELNNGFEVKFVRLTYTGKNQFDFSYFRHTGKWHLVAESLTLDECKDMILSNPVFQPIG